MPSTVFDSAIYRDFFGTPAMRAVWSDEALIARYVEVEVALAKAEARVGLIPSEAAKEIAAKADASKLDISKLKAETDIVGYPIIGIVHQIAKQAGKAGRYVHWGATTQDIMDSATVLQLRAALDIIEDEVHAVARALEGLAAKHRDTVMAGRTHMQHALPVTFGYKAAVWLSSVRRDKARLAELRKRLLVVQFSGAAGTLASLSGDGLKVQAALADELGLAQPDITWHAARDTIAEVGSALAILAGGLAKIATDVMLMMQTEVAEAFEPFVKGRGGSSTMPQKRNPISCEMILAIAKAVRSDASLLLDAMAADHERATGPWHLEWIALPRAFIATAGALYQARFMLEGLIVDGDRMRRNLDITGGLIVAEAAMMALAPHTGRGDAHDIVYDCCRAALADGTTLLAQLEKRADVTQHIDKAALARVVEPAYYLGTAREMIDRMLKG
jgi:3-carboxy-cis,cis-muconate cycloisomerase